MAQDITWTGAVLTETDIIAKLMREDSAWTAYTPTGANLTLGNGTVAGAWARAGRLIHFRASFTLGSTSAVGTAPTLSIPVAYSSGNELETFSLLLYDASATTRYHGATSPATTTTAALYALNASATYLTRTALTATIPFTWATSDVIIMSGFYESAT